MERWNPGELLDMPSLPYHRCRVSRFVQQRGQQESRCQDQQVPKVGSDKKADSGQDGPRVHPRPV